MREWFNKINKFHSLEYLRFSEGTKMESFELKWRKWVEFRAAELRGS